MNILMASKIFVESGVASHIKILSKELVSKGHTVYISSSNNLHTSFCAENNIEFFFCDFSFSPTRFVSNIRRLKKFLKTHKVDVVHCHHRTCGVYFQILRFLTGIPFVWSNHLDNIPSDFLHRITTFYGSKAICVSLALKQFCRNKLRIPDRDIEVVIHGIEPLDYAIDETYVKEFKDAHCITDEKIIGLFARMAPAKGHAVLLDALAKMPQPALDKTKTVLFGGTEGAYVDSLKEKIRELHLENHVIFEGFVTPNHALSLSDITVLPSDNEGFGIVSIESFLFKKPHIRTKTAGYEDLANGCIGIEIGDSDALSKELTAFVFGKDYSELTEQAYRFFQQRCTVEKMVSRILQIYQDACTKMKS